MVALVADHAAAAVVGVGARLQVAGGEVVAGVGLPADGALQLEGERFHVHHPRVVGVHRVDLLAVHGAAGLGRGEVVVAHGGAALDSGGGHALPEPLVRLLHPLLGRRVAHGGGERPDVTLQRQVAERGVLPGFGDHLGGAQGLVLFHGGISQCRCRQQDADEQDGTHGRLLCGRRFGGGRVVPCGTQRVRGRPAPFQAPRLRPGWRCVGY